MLNLATPRLTRGRRPYHSFSNYEPLKSARKGRRNAQQKLKIEEGG
jgi:hypothetical protein